MSEINAITNKKYDFSITIYTIAVPSRKCSKRLIFTLIYRIYREYHRETFYLMNVRVDIRSVTYTTSYTNIWFTFTYVRM